MILSITAFKKVLVIDDELGPRESLRILLKNDYEVHCVDRVEKGLALLDEYQPDVIIMDIRMPGMDGIEGLRRIRKVNPAVAVIMLTGFGALETAQEAIRHGANDYLKKPFDTKEILQVIARNIERCELQQRRLKAEQELNDLNQRLVGELEQKSHLATLGQASAEIVHDLRNPLSVVLGYVQLLAEDLKLAKEANASHSQEVDPLEYVEVIEKSARRCRELLDLWNNLGKSTSDHPEPVNVVSMLQDIKGEAMAMARKKKATIIFDLDCSPEVLIEADRLQIPRTIINLIDNALDALPATGGEIRVSAVCDDREVHLHIADNGEGIPEENLERIFEPYFTSKEKGKGTGLGLYISKRIIENHRGTITVSSKVDAGTTFSLRFPIHTHPLASTL